MTILSSIRARVGLLVGIIFLALLSFVLTDLLSARGVFGGGGSMDVGEINGHSISYPEFRQRIDEIEEQQKRQLNEQETSQMSEAIWQEMVDKYVFEPEWDNLNVTVTDEELAEQMYGDHPSAYMNQFFQNRQTGQIDENFANPDGTLSGAAIRDFVKKMPAETETQWAQIEVDLRKFLRREKYNTLLRKGFYVTTAQAKREYADENTKYNFKYIVKRYAEIPDSTVKVTDAEMRAYYDTHLWKFKQRENSRSMEYVTFDIYPSAEDISNQRKEMEDLIPEYKTKKGIDDSLYVMGTTVSGMYEKKYLHSGQYPVGSDSAFIKADTGEVLGPFNQGETILLYKVLGHKTSADSAKVRHILIAYKGGERADPGIIRTKEEAKKRADSIQRVAKQGKTKLEDMVEKLTDDPGSKSGNKGDYGWFTEESGFVQEFKDAGFKNPVGAIVVVETAFGYHVIEVLDRTKPSMKTQVEFIEKKVEASDATVSSIYNKAQEFAGKNNTGELFTKAAQKDNMNVLKAGELAESSRYISGIENPREIIRWMYDEKTELGAVSSPFQSGERFIVAHLSKIVEKGYKPFEDVKEICELEARKINKGKMFADQLAKSKAASIDQWAAKAGTNVNPGVNVTLAQPYIQGAGYEGNVIGTLATMKQGQLSAPIVGTMGVYVVMLEAIATPEPIKDIKGQKMRLMQGLASRADATASEILKEEAEIVDNRAKHF
jgi:peptidyl-prolyl cis-trans isomerase D